TSQPQQRTPSTTRLHHHSKKNSSIKKQNKSKQIQIKSSSFIDSFIQNQIQRLKESIEIHRNPQNPKIIEKQGYPPRSQKPTFSTFSSIFTTTPKNPFFHHFQTPKTHSKSIQIKKINEIHRKIK